MRLEQWYAEREEQAKRRAEWHEKLRLFGAAFQRYADSLQTDPVTKQRVLQLEEKHGPQDQVAGFHVTLVGQSAFYLRLSGDASVVHVDGVEDVYKGMAITNIVPAGDDAELHFTTATTHVPDHYVAKVSDFMLRVMQARLRAS
jgi:hypothetical protein